MAPKNYLVYSDYTDEKNNSLKNHIAIQGDYKSKPLHLTEFRVVFQLPLEFL